MQLAENSIWLIIYAWMVRNRAYLVGAFMAIISAFRKYRADKEDGRKINKKEYTTYLIVSSSVIYTVLGFMQYLELEMNLLFGMVLYWCGISSEYLANSAHKAIKSFTEKKINDLGK